MGGWDKLLFKVKENLYLICKKIISNFIIETFFFIVKFLEVIKPFCAVLPEIQKPERKVSIIFY
jgi:hypothetical protein